MSSFKEMMMEMAMMERLIGSGNKDNFLDTIAAYEKWMKDKKEEQDKLDKEKKLKEKPKPPVFSVTQVFLILTGLGPFLGLIAVKFQIELINMVIDSVRTIH